MPHIQARVQRQSFAFFQLCNQRLHPKLLRGILVCLFLRYESMVFLSGHYHSTFQHRRFRAGKADHYCVGHQSFRLISKSRHLRLGESSLRISKNKFHKLLVFSLNITLVLYLEPVQHQELY